MSKRGVRDMPPEKPTEIIDSIIDDLYKIYKCFCNSAKIKQIPCDVLKQRKYPIFTQNENGTWIQMRTHENVSPKLDMQKFSFRKATETFKKVSDKFEENFPNKFPKIKGIVSGFAQIKKMNDWAKFINQQITGIKQEDFRQANAILEQYKAKSLTANLLLYMVNIYRWAIIPVLLCYYDLILKNKNANKLPQSPAGFRNNHYNPNGNKAAAFSPHKYPVAPVPQKPPQKPINGIGPKPDLAVGKPKQIQLNLPSLPPPSLRAGIKTADKAKNMAKKSTDAAPVSALPKVKQGKNVIDFKKISLKGNWIDPLDFESKHKNEKLKKILQEKTLPLIKKLENSGAHLKLKPQIYASSSSTIKAKGDLLLDTVTVQKYQRRKQATIYITSAPSLQAPVYICRKSKIPMSVFGKITVHNYADPWHLGGAVSTGGPAQEEELNRTSTALLLRHNKYLQQSFYALNSTVSGKDKSGMNCGNRLYYTENLECLLGGGMGAYERDPKKAPEVGMKFAMVSSTAVNHKYLRANQFESAEKLMKEKIRSTIQAAIANGTDTLVTGSFGCGAFGWSHDIIASMFFEILIGEGYYRCFRTVIFSLASHAAKLVTSAAGRAFSKAFEGYAIESGW